MSIMRTLKIIGILLILTLAPLIIFGNEFPILKLRAKSVQYIEKDKNDNWGDISEPSSVNFLIEMDMNLSRLKFYKDLEPDIFDIVTINKKQVEGRTIMELYCTDAEGLKCIINNINLGNGNQIFGIEYNNIKVIYNAVLLN